MSQVYMVMELCVKGDLLNYINSKLALPERFSHKLFSQLCRAVEYLHSRNVAHRDLKCENLFLDAKYNLKVGDFGLSKTLTYVDGRVVLSRTFCGTSLYEPQRFCTVFLTTPKCQMCGAWALCSTRCCTARCPLTAPTLKSRRSFRRNAALTFRRILQFPQRLKT